MILKALMLLCECLNLAWPIYVQTGESGFNPLFRYTVCLLDFAPTSDLHINMLSTRKRGPVIACLPPACASSQAFPN